MHRHPTRSISAISTGKRSSAHHTCCDLANHPDVLQAAELWLGCKPTIDNIGASWSYPGRDTAKGAQRFHRDFDCSRSFKLFLYLSDVDEETGPHTFVRGSNRTPKLESARAQSDETIIATFGGGRDHANHGASRSWFLEDVYGFHKGGVPRSKPRLLVGIEYNLYSVATVAQGADPAQGRALRSLHQPALPGVMKKVCIIPARGGSKRIPRKNIKPFFGRPDNQLFDPGGARLRPVRQRDRPRPTTTRSPPWRATAARRRPSFGRRSWPTTMPAPGPWWSMP
ncbi:MAG: hypothetical protein WDN06_03260 [Asticcacaulis sp.]